MSWETLCVGELKFREGVSEEEKEKILNEFEEVLEVRPKYDPKFNEYCWCDVNWTSHVEGEKIWKVVKKWRHKLQYFSCSNYYLIEPEEKIYLSRQGRKVKVSLIT